MKVLSLTQPWATLWVDGAKMIETRGFGTEYLGPIAVHASKGFPDLARHACFEEPFKSVLESLGIHGPGALPLGKILGVVHLTACLRMVEEPVVGAPAIARFISLTVPDERLTPNERAFGHYKHGRVAWVTSRERLVLADPIPFKGSQGLRELPAEVAEKLEAIIL